MYLVIFIYIVAIKKLIVFIIDKPLNYACEHLKHILYKNYKSKKV